MQGKEMEQRRRFLSRIDRTSAKENTYSKLCDDCLDPHYPVLGAVAFGNAHNCVHHFINFMTE